MARLLAPLAVALALGACVSAENEALTRQARQDAGLRPERPRLSEAEIRDFAVGKTRVSSAAGLGSQITFMAPDGTAYLWFPGNPTVLRGRWTIDQTGGYRPSAGRPVTQYSVCFRYGENTVNAFDGRRGGSNCVPAEVLVRLAQDRADGDVFGLAGRTEVPFVLSRDPVSIASIRARLGRSRT